ncbi:MAG: hypothetical protein AVDCRST_MAG05-3497 [uncultured Rubrobacteraceae bacterium]|uniref:Glycoside hydrolase family 42 N-terminal domain-containing protein n=1 Tax=uncultured Rubrobacteraceae bacterium TaxID=349277 RepID=A0A6J4TCM9_9ACTN|nr:MAG: hypothetical protein AVDCRST_MAG05-3497 [uncultured Rubrobacteraceae bacterium]
MAGTEGGRSILDGGVSRARFLKLAGLGAGLSLFPGSVFSANAAGAQAAGGPEILNDPKFPIVAWWPPPPVENVGTKEAQQASTDALYAELADAGFNTVIGGNGVSNPRANRLALAACAAKGLRLVLDDSDLRNAIDPPPPKAARSADQEETESAMQALTDQPSRQDVSARAVADRQAAVTQRIEALKAELASRENFPDLSALAGILLDDEPGRSLFPILKFAKEEVRRVFGEGELPYVNVWPSHASRDDALEAESYTDYLRRYMDRKRYPNAVAPPMLSFDHHPLLLADERTTPDFFYNHAVIRNFAQRFGVPSWGFVQSVDFDGQFPARRRPDEDEIFWQINVALAYGVKGIQYFTYWTPADTGVRFGTALIRRTGERTGEKTPLYDSAARANEILRKVGRILLPLTSVSVTHFGERRLPRGAKLFRANNFVKAASGDAAIFGLFGKPNDATERYLLVVNRSPNKTATTRLTITSTVGSVERFDPSIGERGEGGFVPETLTGSPRSFTAAMGVGRAILYRLNTA